MKAANQFKVMKGVVSEETVVLLRWGRLSIQKFGFINEVDNVHRTEILKADVSSVNPSSGQSPSSFAQFKVRRTNQMSVFDESVKARRNYRKKPFEEE